MTDRLEDTRPRPVITSADELPAPPKLLLWSVIGIFVLGVIGVIATFLIFRSVLQPAQQQRVIDQLPFMEAFLPFRDPDGVLPTLAPSTPGGISPQDLLGVTVNEITATQEMPAQATATPTLESSPTTEPTQVAVIPPTDLPTQTSTLEPPTLESTLTPVIAATQQATAESSANPNYSFESTKLLTGITYRKQGWNECGPANITMAMSYYGWQNDHKYAAEFLKWGREDKNVSPSEMVAFVNEQSQLRALTRVGGDVNMVKALVSAGFPVILETSYKFEGYDWLGHYRTIVGYDVNTGMFTINDSFLGEAFIESFSDVDRWWQHFNRRFIVVYRPQDESQVAGILGDLADPNKAAERAFKVAQEEVRQDATNAYAWFNMGSSLVMMGDYERAAVAYTQALSLPTMPFRIMWYQFGAFEAFYEAGRYKDILSYAQNSIFTSQGNVEEIYYWQGKAYAAMGETANAESAYRAALRLRSDYAEASVALDELRNT